MGKEDHWRTDYMRDKEFLELAKTEKDKEEREDKCFNAKRFTCNCSKLLVQQVGRDV